MKHVISTVRDVPQPVLEDIQLLSDGWIKKYLLTYRQPDGSLYEYEAVSRKDPEAYEAALRANAEGKQRSADAVCIVPVLPDDSLLLIREFRYPVNAWVVAFPAGLIEQGESLRDCVDRELKEETGFRIRTDLEGDPVIPLAQSGYSSVGMAEENVQVVIAYVEPNGEPQLDDRELIQIFSLQREDAGRFLETNQDLIGTRCQLLLESVKRTQVLRKRLELAQNPLSSKDFA